VHNIVDEILLLVLGGLRQEDGLKKFYQESSISREITHVQAKKGA
jgi:hypothetical protein